AAGPALDPDEVFAAFDPLVPPEWVRDPVHLARTLRARGFPRRAQRVAEAIASPVERETALGLLAAAEKKPLTARRHLERALELDPDARDARAGLVRLQRRSLLKGDASTRSLAEGLDERQEAVLAGWRAEEAGDWQALRALDAALAAVPPGNPLNPDAVRLQVSWRLAEGGAELARESVALIDRLYPVSQSAVDLVLRARAAAAAGDEVAALVTLFEAAARLQPKRADLSIVARALEVVESLPEGTAHGAREKLRAKLQAG
ncbi:unnamed protein product, partial [marine sediment metagenome]